MSTTRRGPSRGHPRVLSLAVIAALAVSGCAGGSGNEPTAEMSAPDDSAGPSAFRAPEAPGQADSSAGLDGSEVQVRSAELGRAQEAPEPVEVRYPGIDAELPVQPRGVASDGQMDIPDDAAQAAWYQYGKAPADDVGTTVISAHAGSEETPIGPLYALKDARPGEEITVLDESGEEHRYAVTEVEQLGKDGLDFAPYFDRAGQHRLVLITCGGQWIPERNSYADNIIVVAEPAD
ncbi:class F sortase [Nesterenkonia sp. Act20]|uniref:class F sortase n=1 Tax=Nesterenkonia sp. Act20 TaxID=1483432 RepID=UPI001C45A5F2|nr:class F sortase [Nesterenkonia sp. Act20]